MLGDLAQKELDALPWFELGQRIDSAETISQALTMAGLDYRVEKRPIYYPVFDENGTIIEYPEIPNFYATVNTRTNSILGVVKGRYNVLQNEEAFAAFEPLVQEGIIRLDMAGILGENGKKIWMLVEIDDPQEVTTDDVMLAYLLLVNTHDGSRGRNIMTMPIRAICANTERLAHYDQRHEYVLNVRHTGALRRRSPNATTMINIARGQ